MIQPFSTIRSLLTQGGRCFFPALALLILVGGLAAVPPVHAKQKASASTKSKVSNKAKASSPSKGKSKSKAKSKAEISEPVKTQGPRPNPDALLAEIYMDMDGAHLRSALAKADRLVEAYPQFHLAHLIRGDLLMMHARPVTDLGAAPNGAPANKLQDLRAEAMARLKMLNFIPDPDLVPRAFTQLRDDHKYALLVDTRQSRMYVYVNRNGKLSLLHHYYISHGKLGVDKTKEGDQKTPLGIYRITGRIPQAKLPDFYGTGALPLNYPNEWDKVNGRNGSGIWLHGMPSGSFSRPPLASDGCVALTNPDMTELGATIDVYKTLVVISDQVELVNAKIWNSDRKTASKMLEQWRRDMENSNHANLLKNYSASFKSVANEDLKTWFSKQHSASAEANTSVKIRDVTLMRYPGRDNLVSAAFKLDTQNGKIIAPTRRFQLWAKEGTKWKIVYENTIKDYL